MRAKAQRSLPLPAVQFIFKRRLPGHRVSSSARIGAAGNHARLHIVDGHVADSICKSFNFLAIKSAPSSFS